jgi:dihydroorotate dehydrogenase electron transfer subunit
MIHQIARVVENRQIGPGYHRLVFRSDVILREAEPGQFVHILPPSDGYDPLLRRPFSIYRAHDGLVEIIYEVIGSGTRILSGLGRGDDLDVLGPLGRGYRIRPRAERHLLVGGGVGIPALMALAERILSQGKEGGRKITVCLGARSKERLIGLQDFQRLGVETFTATDDGSLGFHGSVVDLVAGLLEERSRSSRTAAVYACGPDPMLKALWRCSVGGGIDAQFSLEQRMGCGFGACLGCVVETASPGTYRRVCCDGPVFDRDELRF